MYLQSPLTVPLLCYKKVILQYKYLTLLGDCTKIVQMGYIVILAMPIQEVTLPCKVNSLGSECALNFVSDNGRAEVNQLKSVSSCITLSGHLSRVVSMCWSPHIGGQLVSVSYDDTAQVGCTDYVNY
jgi:hypothetical protein